MAQLHDEGVKSSSKNSLKERTINVFAKTIIGFYGLKVA
jgi:hypothetical protein